MIKQRSPRRERAAHGGPRRPRARQASCNLPLVKPLCDTPIVSETALMERFHCMCVGSLGFAFSAGSFNLQKFVLRPLGGVGGFCRFGYGCRCQQQKLPRLGIPIEQRGNRVQFFPGRAGTKGANQKDAPDDARPRLSQSGPSFPPPGEPLLPQLPLNAKAHGEQPSKTATQSRSQPQSFTSATSPNSAQNAPPGLRIQKWTQHCRPDPQPKKEHPKRAKCAAGKHGSTDFQPQRHRPHAVR